MRLPLITLLAATGVAPCWADLASIPEININYEMFPSKKIYGGDMRFDKTFLSMVPWPGSPDGSYYIPFEIDARVPEKDRKIFFWATNHIFQRSNIKFVPRTFEDILLTVTTGKGCVADVGLINKRNVLQLDSDCVGPKNMLHLLMHTIGFGHAHQAADKEHAYTLHPENFKEGFEDASDSLQLYYDPLVAYDAASVTHFEETMFSKNGNKTMTMVSDSMSRLVNGARAVLSNCDIYYLNSRFYGTKITEYCVPGQFEDIYEYNEDCLMFNSEKECKDLCKYNSDSYISVVEDTPTFCRQKKSEIAFSEGGIMEKRICDCKCT